MKHPLQGATCRIAWGGRVRRCELQVERVGQRRGRKYLVAVQGWTGTRIRFYQDDAGAWIGRYPYTKRRITLVPEEAAGTIAKRPEPVYNQSIAQTHEGRGTACQ